MNSKIFWTVSSEQTGVRLDRLTAELADIARSAAQKWIADGLVTVDDRPRPKSYVLQAGERVTVAPPEPRPCTAQAEEIPLDIVYEDDDLLVVNKPRGMVVHPAAGHAQGTLVNALLAHCGDSLSGINGVMRPGIVHRIDKDTSGLLMVAKNDAAHHRLAAQIKEHSFRREYEAVVVGHLPQTEGTVDAPIGRHPVQRKKMAVTEKNSKPAVTHYRVLAEYPGYSHVRLRLETGRTHQIRVHMAYLGHPLLGDPLYGTVRLPKGVTIQGQCLHAALLGFVHPTTGAYQEFDVPPPADFDAVLAFLRRL